MKFDSNLGLADVIKSLATKPRGVKTIDFLKTITEAPKFIGAKVGATGGEGVVIYYVGVSYNQKSVYALGDPDRDPTEKIDRRITFSEFDDDDKNLAAAKKFQEIAGSLSFKQVDAIVQQQYRKTKRAWDAYEKQKRINAGRQAKETTGYSI